MPSFFFALHSCAKREGSKRRRAESSPTGETPVQKPKRKRVWTREYSWFNFYFISFNDHNELVIEFITI